MTFHAEVIAQNAERSGLIRYAVKAVRVGAIPTLSIRGKVKNG